MNPESIMPMEKDIPKGHVMGFSLCEITRIEQSTVTGSGLVNAGPWCRREGRMRSDH
jgi:hypothetical protein